MNKAKLSLLACPSLLAFVLLPLAVQARETVTQSTAQPGVEIVFERPTADDLQSQSATQALESGADSYGCDCSSDPMLNFSDEEAAAAIQRYGCDCAGCVSAVRQLQGKLPLL